MLQSCKIREGREKHKSWEEHKEEWKGKEGREGNNKERQGKRQWKLKGNGI